MRLSITAKINFFLLFIFSMVLVFSAAYQAVRERDLILTLIKEQSREQSEAYFDGLNMLMLTGKMDARDTLRAKFLDHAHVEDARIVRGAAVNKQYGAGRDSEAPKDRFHALALTGKGSLEVVHDGIHSKLVVTRRCWPVRIFAVPTAPAVTRYRRTPCWGRCALTTLLNTLFTRVSRAFSPRRSVSPSSSGWGCCSPSGSSVPG